MSDILCRLRMNTEDFQKNIKKSKSEVQGFEAAAKTAGAGVLKFAGFIGVGVTVLDGFNSAMRSNQTTADLLDNNINAAKDTVDAFFRSITTGDWSAFSSGLIGAYNNAYNLSSMIDDLNDKILSLRYSSAEDLRDFSEFQLIATDKSKSRSERIDAAQSMVGVANHAAKNTKAMVEDSYRVLEASLKNKFGRSFSVDELKFFHNNTNQNPNSELGQKSKSAYLEKIELEKELGRLKAATEEKDGRGNYVNKKAIEIYREKSEYYRQFKADNDFLIGQGALLIDGDEARIKEVESLVNGLNAETQALNQQRLAVRTLNKARNEKEGGSDNKKKNSKADDLYSFSQGYFKEWIDAGMSSREAFEKGFKQKGFEIPLVVDVKAGEEEDVFKGIKGSVAEVEEKLAAAQNAFKYATTQDEKKAIKSKIKDLEKQRNALEDNKSASEGLAEGLAGAGNVMRLFNNDALNMAGASLQVISQLIVGKQAEAIASGIAAAFELPFPANIAAAVGVVGTIASLFAQIPAFAEGGAVGSGGVIAGGGSSWADTTLIRANPGEIILNRAQQKNIAAQLSGGSGRQTVQVEVVGKVSGRDLEFVMNKRQQFLNRTR